jgi:hypothetical protein
MKASIDSAFDMPSRIDPFDKLILVVRGMVRAEDVQNEASVDAAIGSVLFIPHGVRHHVADLKPSTLFLMCIDPGFEQDRSDVRGLIDGIGQRICVWDRLPFQTTLVPLWRRLFSEQSSNDVGSEMMIRADVQRLLVRLARSPVQQQVGVGERIQTLVREMERTSFEPWSVDEAAEWVGVSRRGFHLCPR